MPWRRQAGDGNSNSGGGGFAGVGGGVTGVGGGVTGVGGDVGGGGGVTGSPRRSAGGGIICSTGGRVGGQRGGPRRPTPNLSPRPGPRRFDGFAWPLVPQMPLLEVREHALSAVASSER